ncbi:MAG: hypothetical protein JWN07_1775, partial [Hyphomicrobiales bacterium]|nr:hypothetical protein [Hyphomicrobiales bacterium]
MSNPSGAWRISGWTIERMVRMSIVAISSAAILVMAIVSWQLARDAGSQTMHELTQISIAAARARLGDSVQKHVREFEQIAASSVIGTALTDSSGGREGYLAPFLEQRTIATGMIFALYDYRGRLLIRTGGDPDVGGTAMAGEPQGAVLQNLGFRVSPDWIELEAPIRFFADNKPIGFLVGAIKPATLAADTSPAASKFYSTNVAFYVTTSYVDKPMHMKIIETPRMTLAARLELETQTSWIDDLQRKLTLLGFIATVAALVISAAVARWTAKVITSPIGELTAAMAKLRNGEKADPPKNGMPVEIEALSSALFLAFDERSAALQKVQSLA